MINTLSNDPWTFFLRVTLPKGIVRARTAAHLDNYHDSCLLHILQTYPITVSTHPSFSHPAFIRCLCEKVRRSELFLCHGLGYAKQVKPRSCLTPPSSMSSHVIYETNWISVVFVVSRTYRLMRLGKREDKRLSPPATGPPAYLLMPNSQPSQRCHPSHPAIPASKTSRPYHALRYGKFTTKRWRIQLL
jgi:hypothetical protein